MERGVGRGNGAGRRIVNGAPRLEEIPAVRSLQQPAMGKRLDKKIGDARVHLGTWVRIESADAMLVLWNAGPGFPERRSGDAELREFREKPDVTVVQSRHEEMDMSFRA